jgi:hypothetical protein
MAGGHSAGVTDVSFPSAPPFQQPPYSLRFHRDHNYKLSDYFESMRYFEAASENSRDVALDRFELNSTLRISRSP